jgi:hypothetical protein
MPLTTKALCVAIGLITAVLSTGVRTQSEQDPHLPTPKPIPPLNEFIRIDDMLFTPDYYAALTAPIPETSRRQAHPRALGSRFNSWDWGVIPYELAPNLTEVERRNLLSAMRGWESVAPVLFVPRTTQNGFLAVTKDDVIPGGYQFLCFSDVGQQSGYGRMHRTNLGGTCALSMGTIYHEFGHALGLHHEHQRSDRDNFLAVDLNFWAPDIRQWYQKYNYPLVGPYDLLSIMHYGPGGGMSVLPQYQNLAAQVGRQTAPSATDHNVVALVYNAQLQESTLRAPTEPTRSRFDRADMMLAMERLHAFYMSRIGLNRPQGLSINGRPDFIGIAQWIFDVYLPARSAGFSQIGAFDIVAAAITRTDEWRTKNPGRTALTPATFRPSVSFRRDEFLDALNRLDRFYSAPEGLQRPDGLSINGGPDFQGIAVWIFDIYLAERLNGISHSAAMTITENAIRNTGEWRSKH